MNFDIDPADEEYAWRNRKHIKGYLWTAGRYREYQKFKRFIRRLERKRELEAVFGLPEDEADT
jgi:hypothetical protein